MSKNHALETELLPNQRQSACSDAASPAPDAAHILSTGVLHIGARASAFPLHREFLSLGGMGLEILQSDKL